MADINELSDQEAQDVATRAIWNGMSKARMTITGEDLQRYLSEVSEMALAGEYGRGYHRVVKYHVPSGEYRVYDHHELNVATKDPQVAATEFNGIGPRG